MPDAQPKNKTGLYIGGGICVAAVAVVIIVFVLRPATTPSSTSASSDPSEASVPSSSNLFVEDGIRVTSRYTHAVYVVRDEKRKNTCYVMVPGDGVSCVSDRPALSQGVQDQKP